MSDIISMFLAFNFCHLTFSIHSAKYPCLVVSVASWVGAQSQANYVKSTVG